MKKSSNPRSIRARKALHQALKDLLREKSFEKISITEITQEAGLARHTFYNHYETKEDLLNDIIDIILDEFFSKARELNITWDFVNLDHDSDRIVGSKFFEIWQGHADIVQILNSVDIDCLLIQRMKENFEKFLLEYTETNEVAISPMMIEYFIIINSYVSVGLLRQWFRNGMNYSPEVMGDLLNHFAGPVTKSSAIEKFADVLQ